MLFENTNTYNFEGAFHGMRNPMNSWDRSDSCFGITDIYNTDQLTDICDAWIELENEVRRERGAEEYSHDMKNYDEYYNALDKYENWLIDNGVLSRNDNYDGLYNSSFMTELQSMATLYIEWLEEMKRNKRSLDLFNLNSKDKPFEVVTGCKPKWIASIKSDYDLVTDRLNTAVKKCQSKEDNDKFLEMFYIAMSRLFNEKFNS